MSRLTRDGTAKTVSRDQIHQQQWVWKREAHINWSMVTRHGSKVVQRLGGRGCRKFIPVLGDGTKIAPPGDITDQPSSGMSWNRGKFADHVGDYVVVLSPEGTVLVTSPGTESSYPPPPPQSLNDTALVRNYLEVYWTCAGGLSAMNAIGTPLRDPIISGLTR